MIGEHFPWLTTLVLFPLFAAMLVPIFPDKQGKQLRWYALGVAAIDFALMVYAFWTYYDVSSATFQLTEHYTWLPSLGLSWSVSVDGISAPLVLLAGLVSTLSIFSAWQVDRKPRLFYFLMLVLYAAQIGVFVAQDSLLFFIMWELELVPVYLLVCIWGGPKRHYAAMKFLLYTAAASLFILVAVLAMALSGGGTPTFDLVELGLKHYPLGLELFLYVGLLIAFGLKLAMFPLHTWLPDAHGEASAPVSMLLAGVLLKMGAYGLIRFNMELLTDAHIYFAPILVVLGVVNIIYGAFASFAQSNMKRRLAYSSVSHMGFVLIGIASFTDIGMNGAVLQMVSHGLIASVLFFLTGVTYDRTHTMTMNDMGGIGAVMPKVFGLYTAGVVASLALPGMSGFASELAVFIGMTTSPIYSVAFRTVTVGLAAVGLILTPIYLLSMLRQVFYGTFYRSGEVAVCDLGDRELRADYLENQAAVCFGTDCLLPGEAVFDDVRSRELFIAACFLGLIIGIGCYPKFFTQAFDAKTMAVNHQMLQSYTQIAQTHPLTDAIGKLSPKVSTAPVAVSEPVSARPI